MESRFVLETLLLHSQDYHKKLQFCVYDHPDSSDYPMATSLNYWIKHWHNYTQALIYLGEMICHDPQQFSGHDRLSRVPASWYLEYWISHEFVNHCCGPVRRNYTLKMHNTVRYFTYKFVSSENFCDELSYLILLEVHANNFYYISASFASLFQQNLQQFDRLCL